MLYQVFASTTVNTSESEQWRPNFLRENSLHSWKIDGSNDSDVKNKKFVEVSLLLI